MFGSALKTIQRPISIHPPRSGWSNSDSMNKIKIRELTLKEGEGGSCAKVQAALQFLMTAEDAPKWLDRRQTPPTRLPVETGGAGRHGQSQAVLPSSEEYLHAFEE